MRTDRKGVSLIETVGARIRKLRIKHNLSQDELGAYLGVSKSAIQKYESGKVSDLRADKIRLLCEKFHVFPSYFIFTEAEFWDLISGNIQAPNFPRFPIYVRESDMDITLLRGKSEWDFFQLVIEVAKLNAIGFQKVKDYTHLIARIQEYCEPR